MPEEFDEAQRAAQAFREGLHAQADHVTFRPLDPAEFAKPRRRTTRRWIGVGVAAAAAVLAAVLIVPNALSSAGLMGKEPVIAVPAATPTSPPAESPTRAVPGEWVKTSASPLSPRRDAFTTWADGSFFIIGGVSDAPCLDPDGENCPKEPQLSDGARYDPGTDTWTRIADAPVPLSRIMGGANPYPRLATLGQKIYVLTPMTNTFMAYAPDKNTWKTLPSPKDVTDVSELLATESSLIAYHYASGGGISTPVRVRYQVFDPSSGKWSPGSAQLTSPSAIQEAGAVGNWLVVSALTTDLGSPDQEGSLWVALLDVESGKTIVVGSTPVSAATRPIPVTVAGMVAWTDENTEEARFLDPEHLAWSQVAAQKPQGGLAFIFSGGDGDEAEGEMRPVPRLVVGDSISLAGNLYDPVTRQWARVPSLPTPPRDRIFAGGPNSVLSCYGFDDQAKRYAGDCHTLRPW